MECTQKRLLPLGFCFKPTNEELICFLKNKVEGKNMGTDFVLERNMYAREPWEALKDITSNLNSGLWTSYDDSGHKKKVVYVISEVSKTKAKTTSRTAGNGTWDGQTKLYPILENNKVIGHYKMLTYAVDPDHESSALGKGYWYLHEMTLSQESLREIGIETTNYVLNRIIWDTSKSCHVNGKNRGRKFKKKTCVDQEQQTLDYGEGLRVVQENQMYGGFNHPQQIFNQNLEDLQNIPSTCYDEKITSYEEDVGGIREENCYEIPQERYEVVMGADVNQVSQNDVVPDCDLLDFDLQEMLDSLSKPLPATEHVDHPQQIFNQQGYDQNPEDIQNIPSTCHDEKITSYEEDVGEIREENCYEITQERYDVVMGDDANQVSQNDVVPDSDLLNFDFQEMLDLLSKPLPATEHVDADQQLTLPGQKLQGSRADYLDSAVEEMQEYLKNPFPLGAGE